MPDQIDGFVPLDRTFHGLALSEEEGKEAELTRLFRGDAPLRWPELLEEPRVILLSEAGSGKTEEIRHVCQNLRKDKKPAFFLRIEHLAQDFEACFEEGTFEEFEAWVISGADGWLLLDSIDEAKLKDPKDFERAIRKLGVKLRGVLQRAHIVITGRTDAWRPKTDLLICEAALPWKRPENEPNKEQDTNEAVSTTDADNEKDRRGPFRIVALNDLQGEQIDRFAIAKGVTDMKAFKTAISRADAWSFTARPLDLAETVEFWNRHERIGSRLDLMRASIDKRLEERDQDRAEARPISNKRIREGARLVAAAATFAKESAIRVPDGLENNRGLAVKDILTGWDDAECRALLTRPIFDEGIYGTVRFHHRSVREFLTAEWLHSLLIDDGSRAKIENLFFRRQYGIEVIVPTMRPILPWLAILDQRILDRVTRLAPEILFEGGDPSQLHVETRAQILRELCEQLAQPAHGRTVTEYSAVQRFTNPDLADVIRELLDEHQDDEDIVWFLLRMVYQGGITALADKAKQFALRSRAKYTRTAAIRAVIEVGSRQDATDVRTAILTEDDPLRRSWLAELLAELRQQADDVDWLLAALKLAPPKKQYETDPVSEVLADYVSKLPVPILGRLLQGLGKLLRRKPVVERHHCEISMRYSWLGQAAGLALVELIEKRDAAALTKNALSILRQLPLAADYGRDLFEEVRKELPDLVRAWPELNRALFWHCVIEERARLDRTKGGRLTDYWHASIFGAYWGFDSSAFDAVCQDIAEKALKDDKLVALTLGFALYQQNARPRAWRERLKKIAAADPELDAELGKLLNPAKGAHAKFRRQETAWRRQSEKERAKEAAALEEAKRRLKDRIDTIRDPGKPGLFTNDQHYLHEQMRSGDNQNNWWTDGNWQSLAPTFGEEVALAFRDAAVAFWRHYTPQLRLEGAPGNTTPFVTIFGLTGLAIEARETVTWPATLSPAEAELATRYALQELNGFPSWLPQLNTAFPNEVAKVFLMEIGHEFATETAEGGSHYALHDVSWHGDWLWDQLASALLPISRAKRVNRQNLGYLLAIINRSILPDTVISAIVSQKANATRNLTYAPIWFAAWVGVDPEAAIPALAARFAAMKDPVQQTQFALTFIVALLGGRSQEGRAREAYRTVEHMKSLYLLMTRYVREKDDIQRAGRGVYSPGLRDDAQDARNALMAFIRETPGKEAFLALLEMSRAHPDSESRPWMSFHAKNKAATDADVDAWTPSQVQEFGTSLVNTPANHRELWYHAVDKLDVLKHDLENGDSSIASILQAVDQETEFRKFIGGWCRDRAAGRYVISQEEELADAKRPDLRFFGVGFDTVVPAELKLADKWTGPHLFERLEIQVCGDYLRDVRSSRGIFVLVYLGTKSYWELPNGRRADTFEALIDELQRHWTLISNDYPGVEDIRVIGIDLTRRGLDAKAAKAAKKSKKAARKDTKTVEDRPSQGNKPQAGAPSAKANGSGKKKKTNDKPRKGKNRKEA